MSPDADVECPNCGAWFRAGRPACPECGSDEQTGWKDAEEIDYQSVEIPDHWPETAEGPASGAESPTIWWVLGLFALVLALLLLALR